VAPTQPKAVKVAKPSWQNKRATVRYRCPPASSGRLYLAEHVEFQRAWLDNLSAMGIGLLLSEPLEAGLFLTIVLKSASNRKYSLAAQVVHSTLHSAGSWLVGCQFVDVLSEEDLDNLL
jgi:hypothetical protein